MLSTYEQKSTLKLAATVITVVVIAGIVVWADHFKANKTTQTPVAASTPASVPTPAVATPTTTSNSNAAASYKDGTYTASSNYYVPHGSEEIKVSLTLANGTISNASIQNSESDRDSAQYQEDFAAAYKNYVVGKKISGLQLGIIAGASDTTQGFNDALTKIASQAKA